MSDFDPGPGWRRVGPNEVEPTDETIVHRPAGGIAIPLTWVREVPVPALPTALYTVIRAVWHSGIDMVIVRTEEGRWMSPNGFAYTEQEAQESVRTFMVLSEPRAATAKAVLGRVRKEWMKSGGELRDLATVAREFGVES